MDKAMRIGFSFGLTSGIITTLGLIVGLHSGTHSKLVIIGGILTIAIADAFSDALGMHISEESENKKTRDIWISTITTFLTKFIFALTFFVPVFLFDINTAILLSVVWGLSLITILSIYIAKKQGKQVWKVTLEHLAIAILVIIITHYIGDLVAEVFV